MTRLAAAVLFAVDDLHAVSVLTCDPKTIHFSEVISSPPSLATTAAADVEIRLRNPVLFIRLQTTLPECGVREQEN